ncbi:Wzz/FepE/Etk N-terminal domain-containing protein [Vibrio sp. 10N.261.55.A7]|uniref:LPS O-antigen chain length determinant protein WzzB n=1 Tax=Vibrio sp. 10N.261.55.A7 TaxID=1880851 RepID=UPI000CC5D86D|nr:Wzz/FepE/Etk N-terminal domain-containing protein [Vibrio sp. 10N.261.55.A7]PMK05038.1 chain-length determining protein [Vibrio sp. 10N.261.55.A7]
MTHPSSNHTSNEFPDIPNGYNRPIREPMGLRELLEVLWQGKYIILVTTMIFALSTILYTLFAQEWWSSNAKVTLPQAQDYSQYQLQVKQFQPVFDLYQEDGTVLVGENLDDLVDREALFKGFITAFNSNKNKRTFLENNQVFQEFKSNLDIKKSGGQENVTTHLYNKWFSRLSARKADKTEEFIYDLSMQATTKLDSYKMLQDYISFISQVIQQDLLLNLQANITSKKNELLQKKSVLGLHAKQKLEVETRRAEYALKIAEAANVIHPYQSSGDNELFSISLGSKALEAKIEALKKVNNLSVIEPRIQQINSKLDLLSSTQINRTVQFGTFRYLEEPQEPEYRDKPKRTLLVLLGAIFGIVFGSGISLIRSFARSDDQFSVVVT